MKLLGVEIRWAPRVEKALQPVDRGGWWSLVKEPFTGAWQRNISEKQGDVLCYPTLYACISRISKDIGKLSFRLMRLNDDGTWSVTREPSISGVLGRPNHYQTEQQFREQWALSKLTQGNTYVLKQRNQRGLVERLYILNPWRVKPLVSESGDVFYELWTDHLNLLPEGAQGNVIVPAREIIHDREVCLHHPLIGVPPLAAAHWPAIKNLRILRSSAEFFGNGAQPGGILSAPGAIGNETAERLAEYWNAGFTGKNAGRVAVVGDGLKFEALAAKSVDAQMVEQLRYSDEQICQPFGIPPFKVGIGTLPAGQKVDDINNLYYSDALQDRIEHIENLLDQGLSIAAPLGVELDLEPLLRMDKQKQTQVEKELVAGAIKTPNEARKAFDLPPMEGGDAIYLQQQNYSLEALARRDAQDDPFKSAPATPPAPSSKETEVLSERKQAEWEQRALDSLVQELTQ